VAAPINWQQFPFISRRRRHHHHHHRLHMYQQLAVDLARPLGETRYNQIEPKHIPGPKNVE
jgi:hypothetical protein